MMCNKNKKKYYKVMGCVTLVIMLVMLAGLIINLVYEFSDGAGAFEIISTFVNMIAVVILGSGLANLFYSHALMIKNHDEEEDSTCDFD